MVAMEDDHWRAHSSFISVAPPVGVTAAGAERQPSEALRTGSNCVARTPTRATSASAGHTKHGRNSRCCAGGSRKHPRGHESRSAEHRQRYGQCCGRAVSRPFKRTHTGHFAGSAAHAASESHRQQHVPHTTPCPPPAPDVQRIESAFARKQPAQQ